MKIKILIGSFIGYFAAAIFNSLLLIIKETNPAVKTWLKVTFGHHWIGHGILTIIVFILVMLISLPIFKGEFNDKIAKIFLITFIILTLLSVFLIAGFYLSKL